jgi:glycosyltransferase involved in cell wall biosynthesis
VILSRTRGLWTGETLRDGQDLVLVDPGSPDALRDAMQQLLDDEVRREQIGRLAREAVLQHGRMDAFARRLGNVITASIS